MSIAEPGQALVGGSTASFATGDVGLKAHATSVHTKDSAHCDQLPAMAYLRPFGRHMLKGIRKPVQIYEVHPYSEEQSVSETRDKNIFMQSEGIQ